MSDAGSMVNILHWLTGYVVVVITAAESIAVQSPVHDWRLHDPTRQRAAAVRLTAATRQHSASWINATVVDSSWRRQRTALQVCWRAVTQQTS